MDETKDPTGIKQMMLNKRAHRNTRGATCSALVKEAERVLKYLREIGEQTRGDSTFPSVNYADAMADGLEYALKQNKTITNSGPQSTTGRAARGE